MKRFVPLKYIFGMITIFFVIPILVMLLIGFVIGFNKFTIVVTMFLVFLTLAGPYFYYLNLNAASIVIKDDKLYNNIIDGTLNNGWVEDIKDIQKIQVTCREKVHKYYKNCKAKKVLLIDFGSYNIKYIAVTMFTKRQINQILNEIENRRK